MRSDMKESLKQARRTCEKGQSQAGDDVYTDRGVNVLSKCNQCRKNQESSLIYTLNTFTS